MNTQKRLTTTQKENMREYMQLHRWVRKNKGIASHCSRDINHKAKVYHWANISNQYNWNLNDFEPLCPKCHSRKDGMPDIMRIKSIGNTNHNKPVILVDDQKGLNIAFPSAKDASKTTGVSQTSIANAISGLSKRAGGYRWKHQEQTC